MALTEGNIGRGRRGFVAAVGALAVLLTGCSGQTLPAQNISSSAADLTALVSCDGNAPARPCVYQFRYSDGNAWQYAPLRGPFGRTAGKVVINEHVTGLRAGTAYSAQLCGEGDSNVVSYTCANAVAFSTPPDPPAPPMSYAITLDPDTQALVHGVSRGWAGSALTLSGTLRAGSGAPASGVPLTLFAQNGGSATSEPLARTTSDAAGHWTLDAPRGPSRVLSIAYGPAASMQARVTIQESVSPGLSLHVRALRKGRLLFTGRLLITPLGTPRPLLLIEARSGRHWQTVGHAVKVSRTGTYALRYNGGPRAIGGRYQFRAVAPTTSLYISTTSRVRRVLIR